VSPTNSCRLTRTAITADDYTSMRDLAARARVARTF
jgi:hypothetical protein